jgi:hypothetical protein
VALAHLENCEEEITLNRKKTVNGRLGSVMRSVVAFAVTVFAFTSIATAAEGGVLQVGSCDIGENHNKKTDPTSTTVDASPQEFDFLVSGEKGSLRPSLIAPVGLVANELDNLIRSEYRLASFMDELRSGEPDSVDEIAIVIVLLAVIIAIVVAYGDF